MEKSSNNEIGLCPICGHGKLHVTFKGWACDNSSCHFILYAKCFNTTLEAADAHKLINGWTTSMKELTNSKGRKYHARLKLKTNGRLILITGASRSISQPCPNCRGNIRENRKCFYCENSRKDSCQFIVWKEWHGHQFTGTDINQLSTTRTTTEYTDFQDKSGNKYSACLTLNNQGKPVLFKKKKERQFHQPTSL